jgi:hypothetical protein
MLNKHNVEIGDSFFSDSFFSDSFFSDSFL